MDHKGILSSAFNMSLGFIPVIISILLCEFITQDTAIYIGTVIGIVGVYLSYQEYCYPTLFFIYRQEY